MSPSTDGTLGTTGSLVMGSTVVRKRRRPAPRGTRWCRGHQDFLPIDKFDRQGCCRVCCATGKNTVRMSVESIERWERKFEQIEKEKTPGPPQCHLKTLWTPAREEKRREAKRKNKPLFASVPKAFRHIAHAKLNKSLEKYKGQIDGRRYARLCASAAGNTIRWYVMCPTDEERHREATRIKYTFRSVRGRVRKARERMEQEAALLRNVTTPPRTVLRSQFQPNRLAGV